MTEGEYYKFIRYDSCYWLNNCKDCSYKLLCDMLDENGLKNIKRNESNMTLLHIGYEISDKEKELIKDFTL